MEEEYKKLETCLFDLKKVLETYNNLSENSEERELMIPEITNKCWNLSITGMEYTSKYETPLIANEITKYIRDGNGIMREFILKKMLDD
jgi:hypothetical protein